MAAGRKNFLSVMMDKIESGVEMSNRGSDAMSISFMNEVLSGIHNKIRAICRKNMGRRVSC